MAEFAKMVLTHDGLALQGKAQAGASLPFTRVAIGDGTLPEGTHLQELTGLVHEIESLDITELTNLGVGKVRLQARVTNEGRTEGFYIREIGIFANDPDVGEILYAVTNAGDRADYIPEEGGGIIEEILNLITIIGNAEHVTAVIDSASAATVQQVDELAARVTVLEDDLAKDAAPIPYHIQRGQNIVDAVQDTGVSLLSIKGRTDINHVPLFDSGLWTFNNNVTVSSATRLTFHPTGPGQLNEIIIPAGEGKTFNISMSSDSQSIESAQYYVEARDSIGAYISRPVGVSSVYMKPNAIFTTPTGTTSLRIVLRNGTDITNFYIENVMLAEGSHPRPFVANMKPLGAVMIENKGKNLLPPNDAGLSGSVIQSSVVRGPYSLYYEWSGGHRVDICRSFSVVAGQLYTFSMSVTGDYGVKVYVGDANDNLIISETLNNKRTRIIFEAPTDSINIWAIRSDQSGSTTLHDWQLELGGTETKFEPYSPSRIVLPDVGRSSTDGTICDEVYERDGKFFRLQKFGYKVLDGSLSASFFDDFAEFKRVAISNLSGLITNSNKIVAIKYNGQVLRSSNSTSTVTAPDMIAIGQTNVLMSIADTDSGWGESYTPTVDEIKAYFYGWKMFSSTTGNSPYDSGTKAWYPLGNVHGQHSVTSVPLYQAKTTRPGRWQPYQLQYQLAQPVEVEIADIDGLSLHAGLNQVELSEGVVLGEPVTPRLNASGTEWHINSAVSGYESTHLNYSADRILIVYRNGKVDGKWIITGVGTPNGNQRAYISASNYDPTAVYFVDYIVLDKYLLTTNANESELEGQANLATAVGKNVRDIADVKRDVIVIERDFARKQQSGWIEPTLLNGATNTTGYSRVAYRLNNFGTLEFKGVVSLSNTVNSTVIFRLPPNYRPKEPKLPSCNTWLSSSDYGASMLRINAIGEVSLVYGTKTYMLLDGITVSLD